MSGLRGVLVIQGAVSLWESFLNPSPYGSYSPVSSRYAPSGCSLCSVGPHSPRLLASW